MVLWSTLDNVPQDGLLVEYTIIGELPGRVQGDRIGRRGAKAYFGPCLSIMYVQLYLRESWNF